MKILNIAWVCFFGAFMLATIPASAQIFYDPPELVSEPICFELINDTTDKVAGNFVTELYTTPTGARARHRSSFQLEAKGAIDSATGHPSDRGEFCSYGPFFEGRKLELVLRTLFPVFSCYTKIESGPIVIKSRRKTDSPMGGYELWAECHEE